MATSPTAYLTDPPPERYAWPLRVIHWLVALLILALFVLGGWIKVFDPGDGPLKDELYNLHESIGVTVWGLVLLRVVVRASTTAPALRPGLLRLIARLNHVALYQVLFLQPIIGLTDTNAWGFPLNWFGVYNIPWPIGKQPDVVAQAFSTLHLWGAIALLALLAAHIAGALYHWRIARDGVVRHIGF